METAAEMSSQAQPILEAIPLIRSRTTRSYPLPSNLCPLTSDL